MSYAEIINYRGSKRFMSGSGVVSITSLLLALPLQPRIKGSGKINNNIIQEGLFLFVSKTTILFKMRMLINVNVHIIH